MQPVRWRGAWRLWRGAATDHAADQGCGDYGADEIVPRGRAQDRSYPAWFRAAQLPGGVAFVSFSGASPLCD